MLPLNVILGKLPHCNQNLVKFCTNFYHKLFPAAFLAVPFFGGCTLGHLSHFVILLYLLCALINRWNHFWLISVNFPVFLCTFYIYLIFWEWILHIIWKIDCVKSWMMYLDNYCQHMKYKAPLIKTWCRTFPHHYHFLVMSTRICVSLQKYCVNVLGMQASVGKGRK